MVAMVMVYAQEVCRKLAAMKYAWEFLIQP